MMLFLVGTFATQAQLNVAVSPVKIVGQKAIVPLAMTNNLAEPVDTVRAICFLLDDHNDVVGQSTKWVIGGTKDRPALEPKSGTSFNFVITSPQPFATTNLVAKVSFTRVILDGGKTLDIVKVVTVMEPK